MAASPVLEATLHAKIVQGRGLLARDRGGVSDPYCIIKAGSSFELKSDTVKATLTPQWNTEGTLGPLTGVSEVYVEVWDWDRIGTNQLLGYATIKLSAVTSHETTAWYKLNLPEDAPEGSTSAGEVQLKLRLSGGAERPPHAQLANASASLRECLSRPPRAAPSAGPASSSKKKKRDGPGQADLEDSNCAALGSAEDKAARKASALTEPAWQGSGKEPGLRIWRIEQFQVKDWPGKEYGTFFTGDSYILLKTTPKPDGLAGFLYDIYFWLGAETSQDEMGTAAYKTVELDQIFDDAAVQHRECGGHESEAFRALFPRGFRLLAGGVETGFRHVEPEHYVPRLLHIFKKGASAANCVQVPLARASLNQSDAFVLDGGVKIWVWAGSSSSPFEQHKAGEIADSIEADRDGAARVLHTVDAEFWALLGGEGPIAAKPSAADEAAAPKRLLRLSDSSGAMAFTQVGEDRLNKSMLVSSDVMVLDTGLELFVWIGAGASPGEKMQAMVSACAYLENARRPLHMPVTRIVEGGEPMSFKACFTAW